MQQLVLATAFLLAFAGSTPLFAITPYVCDPGTDTHGCECPANLGAAGLDSCTETDHDNLIEASDAAELSNYISATKESGIYFVDIDVESMPGAGVLRLGSDAGEWDDLEELEDFFKVLLDDGSFQFTYDSGESGFYFLPKMRITQRGSTHRFNDVTEKWAAASSNNLIIDVITNEWGVIEISGEVMTLFPWNRECAGYDTKAIASGTDGTLGALQCSDTYSSSRDLSGEDPLCDTHGDPCYALIRFASTIHHTATTVQHGNTLHCSNENNQIYCDLVNGWFTAERKQADEIALDNYYYTNMSYDDTQSDTESDAMELVLFDSWHDGVCALGTSTEGVLEVTLETREGLYDFMDDECDF